MIRFIATLKNSGSAIKIDADAEAQVTFTIPASEIAEVIKLITFQGKAFRVIVVDVNQKEPDEASK